ncbi:MAG: ATP-dependent zinc metalloprotease FtsH [Clostridia bacterium]|nr:ATP-dependent zinc metalloprotease FtsH [Clostridia bacterium]
MKEVNRKPLIFYYLIALGVILLLNWFLMPNLLNQAISEVDYSTFLKMLDDKQVSKVEVEADAIYFLDKDEPPMLYATTPFNDPNLVDRLYEAGCEFGQVRERQMSPLLSFLISWIVPLGMMLLLGQLASRFLMKKMGGIGANAMSFGKSNAKMYVASETGIKFSDVAGEDEAKEALQEIVDFLHNPQKYKDIGAKMPKGALLVGPPGTGKTLLAKAVAGEANVPFFSISGSEFVEMFVGMGAAKVRDLFKQAAEKAPCIVFIDEIDTIGKKRDGHGFSGNDEREQTLNQLLVEMDGFAVNEGIIVMAATNRRDILDPALMRPGRFDRQVTVNYPDQNGRVAILKVHSKGKTLADDVDLNNIAKRMPYATGADLENVMNEAAILAARARKKKIDQQLLIDAIARVQMGPEKKSHKVNEKDRRMVACHEGGHAIIGHVLEGCDEVHLITIVPRGQAAGHTLALPTEEHDNMSRSQLLDQITMMLGGHAAEEVALGEIYTGSSSDLKRATEICRKMVTQFGMSDKIGTIYLGSDQEVFVGMEFGQSREYSEEVAAKIDREVAEMLATCYDKARQILTDNLERLNQLTEALLKYETLNRAEFVALMDTGEVPEGLDDDKPRTAAEVIQQAKTEQAAAESAPAENTPTKKADDPAEGVPAEDVPAEEIPAEATASAVQKE